MILPGGHKLEGSRPVFTILQEIQQARGKVEDVNKGFLSDGMLEVSVQLLQEENEEFGRLFAMRIEKGQRDAPRMSGFK